MTITKCAKQSGKLAAGSPSNLPELKRGYAKRHKMTPSDYAKDPMLTLRLKAAHKALLLREALYYIRTLEEENSKLKRQLELEVPT